MGKGDKRSFKGKVFKGSYGKTRPHHEKKATAASKAPATAAPTAAQPAQHKKK